MPTEKNTSITRRRMLQGAGGVIAAAAFPGGITTASVSQKAASDITGRLARYMVEARDRNLPPEVVRACKHRILDTLGAMVSGARLKPGEMAIRYVRGQGGTPEASVLTTDIMTSAVNAALVNGMFAHADETDDFEPVTKAHPGCSVVPAALAIAERERRRHLRQCRGRSLSGSPG
jgi:2-methylcitrate dehydratase PrpD